jgi:hypothetical protein
MKGIFTTLTAKLNDREWNDITRISERTRRPDPYLRLEKLWEHFSAMPTGVCG